MLLKSDQGEQGPGWTDHRLAVASDLTPGQQLKGRSPVVSLTMNREVHSSFSSKLLASVRPTPRADS